MTRACASTRPASSSAFCNTAGHRTKIAIARAIKAPTKHAPSNGLSIVWKKGFIVFQGMRAFNWPTVGGEELRCFCSNDRIIGKTNAPTDWEAKPAAPGWSGLQLSTHADQQCRIAGRQRVDDARQSSAPRLSDDLVAIFQPLFQPGGRVCGLVQQATV